MKKNINDETEMAQEVPAAETKKKRKTVKTENTEIAAADIIMDSIPENTSIEVKSEKGKKVEKAPKEEKLFPAKKLPGNLKKNYTRKKLQKFLKRIQVPTHRELVESYFVPNPKKIGKFYIPKDVMIPKSKFNKMKQIGKDVASQKFAIKIVPLLATILIIFAAAVTVYTFKNKIARKAVIQTMQGAFGAKTELDYINVEIFGASIQMKGLRQGYKADPMKNLFEFENITIDFNLTEALRGKFDLENIAVEGINVMTARTTSAALPDSNPKEKSEFQKTLENKMQIAQDATKEEFEKLFAQYNPQAILNNLQSQLKSPEVAKEVYVTGDTLVKKWMKKPEEITQQVNDLSAKVNKVSSTDWANLNDPVKIKTAIQDITAVINDGKKLAKETETIINDIQGDSVVIKASVEKIGNALKSDTDFVTSELNKIQSFTIADGVRLISGPIDNILYKTIGKYYPYIKKGVGLAMEAKENAALNEGTKKKKEEVSPTRQRLPGINVYYKRDRVPKFLVEKLSFSGVNFAGHGYEISSDMDKRGNPAKADFAINVANQNHRGDLLVDARSNTKNPLVTLKYAGDNYPIAITAPAFNMTSSSIITGKGIVESEGKVTIGGELMLKNLAFTTEPFEPAFAYDLYSKALSYLKEISIGVDLIFMGENNFDMKISTDADKQFANVLKKLVNAELQAIKLEAQKRINAILQEKSKDANLKLDEFINIENGINAQSIRMDKINSAMEAKRKELQAKLEADAKKAAGEAIGNALKNIKLR